MTHANVAAPSTRAASRTPVLIGALLLVATSEFFLAQIIAQAAWPGYSVSQYDISALGVTACGPYTNGAGGLTFCACSPLHAVMNAGFILLGVFTIAGILHARHLAPAAAHHGGGGAGGAQWTRWPPRGVLSR